MNSYKKIGLIFSVVVLGLVFMILSPAHKALAAVCKSGAPCSFSGEPFNGTFVLQNGQITTTIAKGSADQQQLVFTFTGASSTTETYTSTDKIFCTATRPTPAAAATITMGLPPYGQNINATLHAYYFNGSGCKTNDSNKSISVTNNDTSTGGGGGGGSGGSQGLPATITDNGQTFKLIQQGIPVYYGITNSLTPDCYGGSVLVANAGVTSGSVYTGLKYNTSGGLASLSSAVNSDGLLTQSVGPLINGCGFPASATPAGTTGTIANGVFTASAVQQSSTTDNTDTSGCVFQTNSGLFDKTLSWILCPVINGLSMAADQINGFVEGQLNFSVKDNLDNGSVEKAWATFRDLATVVVVIIMLVMVISQAIGSGPFDAYTVRKMLPKLVAAVIAMQLSWQICIWLIGLANDAGQGIGELMAAPFGGFGALDLPSLLHRLSGVWAAIVGVGATAGIVTGIVFGGALLAFGWPILVLGILSILITLVVALLTLLVRNAVIILLVLSSPLAFIAWVLPGTERYWKYWKDNFVKLMVFFPLVMAMIYGGRIFAWTAGNLGTPGPLDLIVVLVGFFGPYFFLPKTFKWGGTVLSAASKGINESWPIKKGREVSSRELMAAQKRKIGDRAKALDPSKEGYASTSKRLFGVPVWGKGNLRRTAIENIAAGRLIPTKRGLAVAIKRGDAHSTEEDSIAEAKVKREKEKSILNGATAYELNPETGLVEAKQKTNTAGGKASLMTNIGSSNPRIAGAAIADAIGTSSQVELMTTLVKLDDESLANEGAQIFHDADGGSYVMAHETKRWNTKLNATPELFGTTAAKTPIAMPFIATSSLAGVAGTQAKLQEEENARAVVEERPARTIQPLTPQQARAITVMREYTDVDSIRGHAESMFSEYERLAIENPEVANQFTLLLKRIGTGGQKGADTLGAFASSDGASKVFNRILSKSEIREPGGGALTIDHLKLESQARLRGPGGDTSGGGNSGGGGNAGGNSGGGGNAVRRNSFGTSEGVINFIHPSTGTDAGVSSPRERASSDALLEAATSLNEASKRMRQSSVANAQVARRLGNITPQVTVEAPQTVAPPAPAPQNTPQPTQPAQPGSVIQPGLRPEDFEEGGRFQPPDIPPGPTVP